MKFLILFCALSLLVACGGEEEEKKADIEEVSEELTEIKDGVFTQYYPGKKKVKFQGPQDEAGERNGIWYFYSENGITISMTEYKHGLKNGVSMVRYPNGRLQYMGEYAEDKQVGLWKTYDVDGKLIDSTDYTKLNNTLK